MFLLGTHELFHFSNFTKNTKKLNIREQKIKITLYVPQDYNFQRVFFMDKILFTFNGYI